jgi:four helix bundle protein
MSHMPMEELNVYRMSCELADELWEIVARWDHLAKRVVGEQLLRAADSIAANLVEGDARFSGPDSVRFFRYARSSAREVRHWIRRAAKRGLVTPEAALRADEQVVEIGKAINGLIGYRLQKVGEGAIHEQTAIYGKRLEEDDNWFPNLTPNT